MKITLLIIVGLLLSACQSAEEKKAEWIKFCQQGDFNAKQCEVLYSLKQSSDDAKDSADTSAAISGISLGMAGARR